MPTTSIIAGTPSSSHDFMTVKDVLSSSETPAASWPTSGIAAAAESGVDTYSLEMTVINGGSVSGSPRHAAMYAPAVTSSEVASSLRDRRHRGMPASDRARKRFTQARASTESAGSSEASCLRTQAACCGVTVL